ncbi:MAG: class I tRNA ligase family protein [Kouleothrix sp.]
MIGKNIIRFHALYWPAMLLSAGLPLPTDIFVHGFVTAGGRKIGGPLGNVVDPAELAARYGTDALRYYLLREIPSTADGDFSDERLARAYNADLADGLGNLLSRTIGMPTRYYSGVVPAPADLQPVDRRVTELGQRLTGGSTRRSSASRSTCRWARSGNWWPPRMGMWLRCSPGRWRGIAPTTRPLRRGSRQRCTCWPRRCARWRTCLRRSYLRHR